MKVLHVTTHFEVGGITNYILTSARALKARGVDVVVASSGGAMTAELERSGVPHRPLGIRTKFEFGPKAFRSALGIARIVKAERVDIIHAHTRVSQVASLVGSKLAAVPFVTTCHGYFRKRMRALVDSWGAKVVAISAAVRSHLTDDLGVRPERIELIYSGVDAAAFAHPRSPADIAETRKRLGLGAGPVVGTIGRLSPVKGQRYMVGAMKAVIEKRPDCQAVLLGEGTEEPSLRALAASLGISDAVHFYPSCPDTAKFLSIMDVFVFPSVKEGLGIALLEALASGRACVASSIGGIEDILTSGHDGMLVDVGDQKAISDAVLDLLSDGDLRAKMGERGRALVRERFTVESMAERMEDMYRRVLFR